MKKTLALTWMSIIVLALSGCQNQENGAAASRSQIRIVGSSTVYPFTTAVAERFAQASKAFGAPIVESTGTGAGMKLFCAGVGVQYPDIEDASRRIKQSEFEDCRKNGVARIIEIPIGIDGLAFIESKKDNQTLSLTVTDIYKALAANPYGKPNTAKTWKDVNPALPAVAIQVYGPPPTSGTRDSLAELILEKGCDANPDMKALKASNADKHKDICTKIREDGAYIEAGENDNLLVQKVATNSGTVGVLGYSFYEQNMDRVRAIAIGGITPDTKTISSLSYPGARQLYLYVKGEHVDVIPGIKEFLAEYVKAWGDKGYLVERGLIASPADVQTKAAAMASALTPIDAAGLK